MVLGLLSSAKSVVETEHLICGGDMLKLMQYLKAMATEGLKALSRAEILQKAEVTAQ